MTKKVLSVLALIFAYTIPMMVGIVMGCTYAAWLIVPMILSILWWTTSFTSFDIWSALLQLVLGLVVTILVLVSANFLILFTSVGMLIVYIVTTVNEVFG